MSERIRRAIDAFVGDRWHEKEADLLICYGLVNHRQGMVWSSDRSVPTSDLLSRPTDRPGHGFRQLPKTEGNRTCHAAPVYDHSGFEPTAELQRCHAYDA